MDKRQVSQLRQFVDLCKARPQVIHLEELDFFRKWLESLGANIPDAPMTSPATSIQEEPKTQFSSNMDSTEEPAPSSVEEEETIQLEDQNVEDDNDQASDNHDEDESEESDLEFDNDGVIESDHDEPQPMGDVSLEVDEEAIEEAQELRDQAIVAAAAGDFQKAIEFYTEAIVKNPTSALLYSKRARAYIEVKKPNAAIRDCDMAVSINPDSAQGYKFRGIAHRLLGHWKEAAKDLRMACKLDYDDDANMVLKEIEPKAKRIEEHQRKYERQKQEKEIKERLERIRKAREEQAQARAKEEQAHAREEAQQQADEIPGGFAGGMGGMPGTGGKPNLSGLMSDPEIAAAFQDSEVIAAFQDVSRNPANIGKYQSNPKVMSVIQKIQAKMGNQM